MLLELPSEDHLFWVTHQTEVLAAIQEFVTGEPPVLGSPRCGTVWSVPALSLKSPKEVAMLTTFQKSMLATVAGAAVLLALVISAKGATGSFPSGLGGGTSMLGLTPIQGGAIAPGILTTGDGTAKVRPDTAIISVGAVAQGNTASEAQTAIATRVDQILKRAKDLGISDADIKNGGYNIQPQYASGPDKAPHITGYQASQQITLTLRKVDSAGKALDALVQGDVAANTVSIRLTLDDPKPAQADARRQAIADARSKADAMAKAAGVSLGRIIAISDMSSSAPFAFDQRGPTGFGAAASSSQIPVGDLDVAVRVQVQFEIQ